jgi:rRNA-processing protein FCF1
MRTAVIFPDTNTFLHYPSIEQIDWPTHLSAQKVIIVVAPVVVRELNKKKDTPGPRKLRERASSVLKTLRGFSRMPKPVQVRKDVEVRFLTSDPSLAMFDSHDLRREVPDDYLVAAILSFAEETNEGDVILVTHDLGLELKANAKNIPTVQLPENLELPQELDLEQKRIRELEQEVLRLERRLPNLALVFSNGQNRIQIRLRAPVRLNDAILEWRMRRIYRRFPKIDREPSAAERAVFGLMAKPAAIAEYNGQLDDFYMKCREHYARLQDYLNYKRRIARLEISLVNRGSTPAEDVDILLIFPSGFELCREAELTPPPRLPEPPTSPYKIPALLKQSLEQLRAPVDLSNIMAGSHLRTPEIRNVSHPTIRKTNSYDVEVNVGRLKHGYEEALDSLYVVFPSYESASGFSVTYGLYAANAPEKQEGKLFIILEKQ